MIRILLIPSSDYLGHPFPQRHNHLFERIHDGREYEVHIIRFNLFGKPKLKTRCVVHEMSVELKTPSTPLYYLFNSPSFVREILRIIRNESVDAVVAGNLLPPFLYKLFERLMERRIPFVLDLQDYYPVSATGYITDHNSLLGSVLRGLFEAMTQRLIRAANAVTVPGLALAYYAREVGAKNVHIVPNGISEHFLRIYDGREVREKLGFDNDVVVGYIGSIEFWLDMEPLVRAIARARNRGIPVRFLVIGKHLQTGYPKKLSRWLERYDVSDITIWLDFVPYESVPKYIAAMDVCTIPFDVSNLTAYYAAPNKMWEYLSQGKLVVSTPIPESLAYRDLIHIARSDSDYYKVIDGFKNRLLSTAPLDKIRTYIRRRLWEVSAAKFKQLIRNLVRG